MNTTLHEATRDMLLRERAAVLARIETVERDAHDLELDTDGVPHSGFERDHALGVMLDSRLIEIDNALARIDGGTYGVCATCKNEIPPKRLEALPFATLCVQCQSIEDKRAKHRPFVVR